MKKPLISLSPRISEQTFSMSEDGVYVFEVPMDSSKPDIIRAIEDQFKVSVKKLNTAVIKGKKSPSTRRARQSIYGQRSSIKKAYASLAEGDKITIFEEGA